MPTINLISATGHKVYFTISTKEDYYATCADIAEVFNLDTDTYNKILVDKVIQHDDYDVNRHDSIFHMDIMFELKNIKQKIYVERFKEAFAPQLTLITLGDESSC